MDYIKLVAINCYIFSTIVFILKINKKYNRNYQLQRRRKKNYQKRKYYRKSKSHPE